MTEPYHPRWAERTYYLLHVADGLTINAGRQLYRHAGHWATFVAASTPTLQVARRERVRFAEESDPDSSQVGRLRIEVVEPLRTIRLVVDDEAARLRYDLTYEARFAPVAHEPTRVEKDGQLVTNTMSFFQSGLFSGTVALDGREWNVEHRAGFRDRSWGLRAHDGAPGRGLAVFAAAEFADCALYVMFYETASGRRPYIGGWLMTEEGVADTVVAADDELRFAESWLEGGVLTLTMASGAKRRLEFMTQTRLFLPAVGYSSDPAKKDPGVDRFDLTQAATCRALEGQTDHGSRFTLDGEAGHGYVEVGRGTHVRYRPAATTP
jgi:hypothetical protein